MAGTILPDGTNQLGPAMPDAVGWVVETIIEGRMAWMVEPVPGQPYTFSFDIAQAYVFERYGEARDSAAAQWCWHDRHGVNRNFDVMVYDARYRADIARDFQPADPLPLQAPTHLLP